jgi:hypothetical protein
MGVKVQIHIFLTSALDEGEWSASCCICLTSGERASDTHWVELVWALWKGEKFLALASNQNNCYYYG